MSNVKTVKLESGKHEEGQGSACVMEVVSMLAGEPFTDQPDCACPVLTQFAIGTNDWMDDGERQSLWPFTTRLAGSAGDWFERGRRSVRMADWAVREVLPLMLESIGMGRDAEWVREMPPLHPRNLEQVENGLEAAFPKHDYREIAFAGTHHNHYKIGQRQPSLAEETVGWAQMAVRYARQHETNLGIQGITAGTAASNTAVYVGRGVKNHRERLFKMRLALLDELCPPAPMPDEAVSCLITETLENNKVAVPV